MSDPAGLVFVDCETTGLDPERHLIWEVALLVDGEEYLWHPDHDLDFAEPGALRINRYYSRRRAAGGRWPGHDPALVARVVAELTAGRVLGGACPWFDARFLEVFLREHGECPVWSHRHCCVYSLAAGALRIPPPWDTNELSLKMGIDPQEYDRHTALGDARYAAAIYDAVMRGDHA